MRRLQSIGVLLFLITGLLVVMLTSIFVYSAFDAYRHEEKARALLADVRDVRQLLAAAAEVRSELALSNLVLESSSPAAPQSVRHLEQLQRSSERVLDIAVSEAEHREVQDTKSSLTELRRANASFRRIFPPVSASIHQPRSARDPALMEEWKTTTTSLTRSLSAVSELLEMEAAGQDPFIDATMKISDAAWNLRMDAGRERGFMQTAIIDNHVPTPELLEGLAQLKGRVSAHWATIQAQGHRSAMPAPIKQAVARTRQIYFDRQMTARESLLKALTGGKQLAITGEQWVGFSNPGLAAILAISTTALNLCEERAAQLARDAQHRFLIAILLTLASLGLAVAAIVCIVWRVIRPLKAITRTLHEGTARPPSIYSNRNDEIGEFARALLDFRTGAIERERLKAELMQQRSAAEIAEAASRVKSEFLANMSHELRTPLNAILGFSEIMKTEMYGPIGDIRYRDYSQDIHKSGAHLLDLINDVLDLSKLDAGRMELRETRFDIAQAIAECVHMVREKARGRVLDTALADDMPAILADQRLIKQILLNLLSNALKFTPENGRVTLSACLGPEGMTIEVTDTGIGMEAHELEVAFSQYGQVDSRIARQHQGTGLGLPISRALAELHGGTLTATSVKGAGTTVTLALPGVRLGDQFAAA